MAHGGCVSRCATLLLCLVVVVEGPSARGEDCNGNGAEDGEDLRPGLVELTTAFQVPTAQAQDGLVAADLDLDGDLDLILGHGNRRTLTLLRNHGPGRFESLEVGAVRPNGGGKRRRIMASDLDGDGMMDVLVGNPGGYELTLLRGTGQGRLEPWKGIAFPDDNIRLECAQILDGNLDGLLDLAVLAQRPGLGGTLYLIAVNGKGPLQSLTTMDLEDRDTSDLVARDLDGDGLTDLTALLTYRPPEVEPITETVTWLHPGLAEPWTRPIHTWLQGQALALNIADLDGDGKPDALASVSRENTGSIQLGVGRGDGGFRAWVEVGRMEGLTETALIDLKGEGHTDLVLCGGLEPIKMLFNDGQGKFPTERAGPVVAGEIASADLDGDGRAEIAATEVPQPIDRNATSNLTILRSAPVALEADCDRNGVPDSCQTDCDASGVPDVCEQRTPDHHFQGQESLGAGDWSSGIDAADLEGDGDLDLLATVLIHDEASLYQGQVAVFKNAGDLGFIAQARIATGERQSPGAFVARDFDGDGMADVAYDHRGTQGESSLRLRAAIERPPVLGGRTIAELRGESVSILASDWNGDGKLDLLLLDDDPSMGQVARRLVQGKGGAFLELPAIPTPHQHTGVIADLDGDGVLEVVTGTGRLQVLSSAPDGELGPRAGVQIAGPGVFPAAAIDLDLDGDVDLIGQDERHLLLIENMSPWTFGARLSASPRIFRGNVTTADMNGDGHLDLLAVEAKSGCAGSNTVWEVFANPSPAWQIVRALELATFLPHRKTEFEFEQSSRATANFSVAADWNLDGRLDLAILGASGTSGVEIRVFSQASGGFVADCDQNGVPDTCDEDCDQDGLPDTCAIASGVSADCDGNGVPDSCSGDCDRNGLADSCELSPVSDCDQNDILDVCELAGRDENRNGRLDVCDLSSGASTDCNQNDRPDEVDITPELALDAPRYFNLPCGQVDCAADFQGNGALGLVVLQSDGRCGNDQVLLGTLEHGVRAGSIASFSLPGEPLEAQSADLDGDQAAEILVHTRREACGINSSLTVLFLGPGLSLRHEEEIPLVGNLLSLARSDFSGDGKVDLVLLVERESAPGLQLWTQTAAGLFGLASVVPLVGLPARRLASGDVDGDGRADLVAAQEANDDGRSPLAGLVLFGDGQGSFRRGPTLELPVLHLTALSLADFDRDGRDEVLVGGGGLHLLWSGGDGEPQHWEPIDLGIKLSEPGYGRIFRWSVARDLNSDGWMDLVGLGETEPPLPGRTRRIGVVWGLGRGQLSAPLVVSAGPVERLIGSVPPSDRDDPALLIVSHGSSTYFQPVPAPPNPLPELNVGPHAQDLRILDLDQDGHLDVAVILEDRVQVNLQGFGPSPARFVRPLGAGPVLLATSDMNADGRVDVVTANSQKTELPDSVSVFLLESDGLSPGKHYAVGRGPVALHAGPVDHRPGDDVLVVCRDDESVSLLSGAGNGQLAQAAAWPLGGPAMAANFGDIDGDGNVDVAAVIRVAGANEPTLKILSAGEHGDLFVKLERPLPLRTVENLQVVDADRDGRSDVLLHARDPAMQGRYFLLRSPADGLLLGRIEPLPHVPPFNPPPVIGDLDRDGNADLVGRLGTALAVNPAFSVFPTTAQESYRLEEMAWPTSLVDVDGNGFLDVALLTETGRLHFIRNLSAPESADRNQDGQPDECALSPPFLRGDTTGDSTVNLADAVLLLRGLFLGATQPECGDAADVDDNGRVNLADAVHLLGSLFLGKGGLPAPFPNCGLDTTLDELPCTQPAACSRQEKPR